MMWIRILNDRFITASLNEVGDYYPIIINSALPEWSHLIKLSVGVITFWILIADPLGIKAEAFFGMACYNLVSYTFGEDLRIGVYLFGMLCNYDFVGYTPDTGNTGQEGEAVS